MLRIELPPEVRASISGERKYIEGVEDVLWRKWYGNPRLNPSSQVRGLEFFIDSKSRSFIPNSPKRMKIDAGPAYNRNRHSVNRYLRKTHPTPLQRLVIVETLAELELDGSVHGICDKEVAFNKQQVGAFSNFDHQLNLVLIHGGNTYGKVRIEIWETTKTEFPPDTILIQFADA